MLKRVFIGWLRGERDHCRMVPIATQTQEDAKREGCLAGQAQRIATVTTMTDTVIARLEKSTIIQVIHQEPAFSEKLIAHLLARSIRVEGVSSLANAPASLRA